MASIAPRTRNGHLLSVDRKTGCVGLIGLADDAGRYDAASRADLDLILPVFPLHMVQFQVTGNGRADGREE